MCWLAQPGTHRLQRGRLSNHHPFGECDIEAEQVSASNMENGDTTGCFLLPPLALPAVPVL